MQRVRGTSRTRLTHIENSQKAMVPQLQFDVGYMENGGPLEIACFLVGTDTSSGAIHATMVRDSKKMDMPMLLPQQQSRYVTWSMTAFVYMETKEFFSCCWTKSKERRAEGQDWQILRQLSPTQSHQSNGAAEKSRLHNAWTC